MKFKTRKSTHETRTSSAIRSIDYNAAGRLLTVTFTGGNSATYIGVPQSVVDDFKRASSHGSYFNTYIKPNYHTT